MAAKVRPAVVMSIPAADVDRALVTVVPHTTSARGSRFETAVSVAFLRAGVFDAQNLVTIPHAKLVRDLGKLSPAQFGCGRACNASLAWPFSDSDPAAQVLSVRTPKQEERSDISPEISADSHLRRPFRAFGRWWTFWALFPFVPVLPEQMVMAFGGWVFSLVWIPLFFWSGLRPMRLWMQRPRPVWLFFFLWMGIPFLLFILVGAALRLIGLYGP